MKLIIVRHAKSSWSDQGLRDHDRPLAPRGQRAAAIIGKWLTIKDHQPSAVICSTATRASQTWERISPHLESPEEVRFTSDLYHAGRRQIWKIVQQCELSPLLIVGHNPGFGDFARAAVQEPPRRHEFFRYPTAATAVCTFNAATWSEARMGTAQLVDFTIPRDHA